MEKRKVRKLGKLPKEMGRVGVITVGRGFIFNTEMRGSRVRMGANGDLFVGENGKCFYKASLWNPHWLCAIDAGILSLYSTSECLLVTSTDV